MHIIESGYEAMVEAVVEANLEKRSRLWAASAAWYLYRRNTLMAKPYWAEIAAKLTSELSDHQLDQIAEQLTNPERLMVDEAPELWPILPESITSMLRFWNPEPVEDDLDALREEAVRAIDKGAEFFRTNFITPGSGQAMAYQQKLSEARDYLANPEIDEIHIPHIVLEARVENVTLQVKAEQIVQMFAEWQQVSARIEARRAAAKGAIAEATSKDAIKAAALINWNELLPEPVEEESEAA